jgi:predicted alpha/beta hydrolase
VTGTDLEVTADDGVRLPATLFAPKGEARAAVLLAGAMGVRRRFYGPLAEFLSEDGLAVMTVDYRGLGNRRPASRGGSTASLRDWGEKDLPAAVAHLRAQLPALPLVWFGHSVGGQLLGLTRDLPVRAALLVASQSGYWGHWSGRGRVGMWLFWHAVLPTLVAVSGRLPMRALGQGDDVPAGVAREWARWGRSPEYIGAYARTQAGIAFQTYDGPLRSYAFTDDPYAPPRATEALLRLYAAARPESVVLKPADRGQPSIGHFGAFREPCRHTLWREWRDWIVAGADLRTS